MSRRLLQVAVAIFGCVPVFAGLAGVILGPGMTEDLASTSLANLSLANLSLANLSLDSHVRYLSGLLLGIGLVFWWHIPRIERATTIFRTLTLIVFVGGLSRLLGAFLHGLPPAPMLFGLVMELCVTPALCVWQSSVARKAMVRGTVQPR